jgi:hypothetical protein
LKKIQKGTKEKLKNVTKTEKIKNGKQYFQTLINKK